MVTTLLVVAVAIAVAVLVVFVVGYNRVRTAAVRVDEALGGIDVQLTRRAALIPGLVHTVQTFAAHERGVLDQVSAAPAGLAGATAGPSTAQRSAAERELDGAVGRVLALGQVNASLGSSANFLDLQRNLADTEDKLAFARQYYNDTVATNNRLVTSIPWMWVAGAAGATEREYYQPPR